MVTQEVGVNQVLSRLAPPTLITQTPDPPKHSDSLPTPMLHFQILFTGSSAAPPHTESPDGADPLSSWPVASCSPFVVVFSGGGPL